MHPFLQAASVTVLYIAVALGIALLARAVFTVPDELFRKTLHFILLGAYVPLVFAFPQWWMAAAFAASLMVILFPALYFTGKIPMFSAFMNERKKGEMQSSMFLAVGMMAFSVTVCWGLFSDRHLVLACVWAWGIGDAFAALIGKRFGRHKINWKFADGKKSVEGSLAMFFCAFVSVFTVLLVRGGIGAAVCMGIAALAAAVCTFTELCARDGLDTVLCPVAAMAVIIPLVMLA